MTSRPRPKWAILRSPVFWHFATLVVGFVVIMVLQRNQWFYYDEWNFLDPERPGPFASHNGHFSLAPRLVYDALLSVVGLSSYWPYALCVTILHLLAAHLAWRIAIRAGAGAWSSTLVVLVFVFLGSGGQNIFWAFQIGFVGALAFGLLAFLIALRPVLAPGWLAAATAIGAFSLTWSGTAIPIFVATALLVLLRHRWRKALIFLIPGAVLYLTWYIVIGHVGGVPTGSFGATLAQLPGFLWALFATGFGGVFTVSIVGAFVVVLLTIWVITALTRKDRPSWAVPLASLGVALVLFAAMTGWSRAGLAGPEEGAAGRYVYAVALLLVPAVACAASVMLARWPVLRPAGVALAITLTIAQGIVLVAEAGRQAGAEQQTRALVCASLDLALDAPTTYSLEAMPDPLVAPQLTLRQVLALHTDGHLATCVPGSYPPAVLEIAARNLVTAP